MTDQENTQFVDGETESSADDDVTSFEKMTSRVEDAEQYGQLRRMKEIYDARERVREDKSLILDDVMLGRRDGFDALTAMRKSVENYLQLVEPLMTVQYPEVGVEYWRDIPLGEMQVEPPQELVESEEEPNPFNDYHRVVEPAEPFTYEFEGVGSILETPSPFEVEFTAVVDRKHGYSGEVSEVKRQPVTEYILDSACREVSKFFAEIGLDLDRVEEIDVEAEPF